MEEDITYRAVYIVDDSEKIKLLADFTREEILRLLSAKPMTETQLSQKLGLTKAAIGYHLHLLEEAGLVHIERLEAEKHGILQKYYSPAAALFIVDPEKIPKEVRTYFVQTQIQFLRGLFSAFKINHHVFTISSKDMEELALALLDCLKKVGRKYVNKRIARKNSETVTVKIYAEALATLTKRKEWRKVMGKAK